jgi:hypothetical protein
MKGLTKQQKVNAGLRLLDNHYNITLNAIKVNVHNTIEHELAKAKVAYFLIKSKKDIVVEAIFRGGGRADIFVPETMQVYEILKSEKLGESELKKNYYPPEVDLLPLESTYVLSDGWCL